VKALYHIGPVLACRVGAQVVDQLISIHPEGKGTHAHSFTMTTTEDDPRLGKVFSILEGHGLKPCRGGSSPNYFSLNIERHYSRAELHAAQLLEFYPKPSLLEVTTRPYPGGPIQVPARSVTSQLTIFDLWMGVFGVSRPVKEAMEADCLRGVRFDPIEVIGPGAARWAGYVWQLSSAIRMPKLSPRCQLVYGLAEDNERPFDGDYSRLVMFREGFYSIPEKHYRKSDIDGIGDFALAHTFERFGSVGEQSLIAGMAFYQFCVKHRFKIEWWPVHSDPD